MAVIGTQSVGPAARRAGPGKSRCQRTERWRSAFSSTSTRGVIDGSRSAGARVGERVTSLNTSHLTYLKTIPGESSTSDYLHSVRSLLSLLSNILEGLEGGLFKIAAPITPLSSVLHRVQGKYLLLWLNEPLQFLFFSKRWRHVTLSDPVR